MKITTTATPTPTSVSTTAAAAAIDEAAGAIAVAAAVVKGAAEKKGAQQRQEQVVLLEKIERLLEIDGGPAGVATPENDTGAANTDRLNDKKCDDAVGTPITSRSSSAPDSYYSNERYLTALVLLTRVDDDFAARYRETWTRHHPTLAQFCRSLLLDTAEDDEENEEKAVELVAAYARLVARLLGRFGDATVSDGDDGNGIQASSTIEDIKMRLGRALIGYLQRKRQQQQHTESEMRPRQEDSTAVSEIVCALQVYFDVLISSSKGAGNDEVEKEFDAALTAVWELYGVGDSPMSAEQQQQQQRQSYISNIDVDSADVSMTTDTTTMATIPPGTMMKEVLIQILNANQQLRVGLETEEEVISVLEAYGPILSSRLSPEIPTFFQPLLGWWLERQQQQERQQQRSSEDDKLSQQRAMSASVSSSWARVLLLCLLSSAAAAASTRADTETAQIQPPTSIACEDVTRLVLACVVSTSTTTESEDLRSLAWSVVTSLVDAWGWGWLVGTNPSTDDSSTKLGRGSKLCTLLRLASGELSIQLGLQTMVTDDERAPESRLRIVQACSKFMMQVLGLVVQLADAMDEDVGDDDDVDGPTTISLSSEALLHVRRSLEDAMYSSAQYLGIAEKIREVQQEAIDVAVIQLLGGLLSEFDIFEKQYFDPTPAAKQSQDQDGGSNGRQNEVLSGVRAALDNRYIEAQQSLLPGLLALIATCEGDESRISLLNEFDILGEPLVNFMKSYWDECSYLESVLCALELIEMLYDVMESTKQLPELLPWISRFIQRTLSRFGDSGGGSSDDASSSSSREVVVSALSAAVACYVTIRGDAPPDEPDASVIRRAIEFCGSST